MSFIGIGEQKHAVAVTTAKPVAAFRILSMVVNLIGLTTVTMNGNAGHSKGNIIHQFN